MIHFVQFLHVFITVIFSGGILANLFYFSLIINENNINLTAFALRKSIMLDCLFFFPIMAAILVSGSYQVILHQFSFSIPWIKSAYFFWGLILIIWLINFYIKYYNFISLEIHRTDQFRGTKFFKSCYVIMLILLVFIIHDAVRKTTFLPWSTFS